jgi:hypothetical protein
MRFSELAIVLACLLGLGFAYVMSKEFVHTPVGPIPADCLHKVPSGTFVEERENEVILRHHSFQTRRLIKNLNCSIAQGKKRQFPSYYDGWLAYTTWQYPQGIGKFYGNFSVPTTAPKRAPVVLYLFTGLQNIDWIPKVDPIPKGPFDIIQPVLQYPADSGNGWSVKSWYVTLDQGVIVSDEIPVSQGEVIYSYMVKTGQAQWEIAAFNKKGQSTIIHPKAPRLTAQPWAYNTAECYGCTDCSYEPTTPCHFTDLILEDTTGKVLTPAWKTSVSPKKKCKEIAVVNSPSSVDIFFQGQQ